MTTSKMKPLMLTNAIAINMTMSIAILTGILFFNITPYYYVHGDAHDDIHDVHGMNNLYRNL